MKSIYQRKRTYNDIKIFSCSSLSMGKIFRYIYYSSYHKSGFKDNTRNYVTESCSTVNG